MHGLQRSSGLDQHGPPDRIDRNDAAHPLERDLDFMALRVGAVDQAGQPALWQVRAESRRWRQSQIDALGAALAAWLKRWASRRLPFATW